MAADESSDGDASMLVEAQASDFDLVAAGLAAYVTRLMCGCWWAVVMLAPLETALALGGGSGAWALAAGVGLEAAAILAIRHADQTMPWMRRRPVSLVLLAVVVAAVLSGFEATPLAGHFGSLIYLPIGLAALAGLPEYAVACALVVTGSEVVTTAFDANESLADLVVDERWLVNAALPLMLALALSIPVWFLVHFMGALPETIAEVELEVADPPPPLELPPGADPWEVLSPAEQRVVERLPDLAPKQIALSLGLSLATVRTHLLKARRVTGSRTLGELAAWAALYRPGVPT